MVATGLGTGNELEIAVTADDRASGALQALQGNVLSLKTAVAGLGAALGAVAVGGIAAATRRAANLETAFAEVETLMDADADAAATFGDAVARLSTEFAVQGGQVEVVNGLYQTLSAGITTSASATQLLETAIKSAQAGLANTETAIDALTTVVNAYGLEASAAGRVSDVLFETVRRGKTRLDELAGSIGRIVPISSELGINFEEVAASVATLTKQGQSTDEAVTAVRQAMVELMKPSEDLQALIEGVGIESGRALVEAEGFGGALRRLRDQADEAGVGFGSALANVRAMQAALPLSGDAADAFREDLAAMQESAGATDEAFRKISESAEFKFRAALNSLNQALATTGKQFLPLAAAAAEAVTGVLEAFNEINRSTDGVVGAVGLAAGAIGGFGAAAALAVSQVGGLSAVVTALSTAVGILTGPVGIAIAAVAALAAAFATDFGGIRTAVLDVVAAAREQFLPVMLRLRDLVVDVLATVRDAWDSDGGAVSSRVRELGGLLKSTLIDSLRLLAAVASAVLEEVAAFWDEHGAAITDVVLGTIVVALDTAIASLRTLRQLGGALLDLLAGDFESAGSKARRALTGAVGGIVSFLRGKGRAAFSAAVRAVTGVVEDVFEDLRAAVIGAGSGGIVGDMIQFIQKFIRADATERIRMAFFALGRGIRLVFEGLATAIIGAGGIIRGLVEDVVAYIESGNARDDVFGAFDTLAGVVTGVFETLKREVIGEDGLVRTLIADIVDYLKHDAVGDVRDAMQAVFDGAMAAAEGFEKGLIGNSLVPQLVDDVAAEFERMNRVVAAEMSTLEGDALARVEPTVAAATGGSGGGGGGSGPRVGKKVVVNIDRIEASGRREGREAGQALADELRSGGFR